MLSAKETQRPFVNNYAPNFILYELSSPFLNAHWCFDKLNMTGSRMQLTNGVVLLVTFFLFRLVWGPWQSMRVSLDVIRAYRYVNSNDLALPTLMAKHGNSTLTDMSHAVGPAADVPSWIVAVYLSSNVVLNVLNFYWFTKMITAIKKRFTGEKKAKELDSAIIKESKYEVTVKGTIKVGSARGLQVTGVERVDGRKRKS